jgi:hypothetical protein
MEQIAWWSHPDNRRHRPAGYKLQLGWNTKTGLPQFGVKITTAQRLASVMGKEYKTLPRDGSYNIEDISRGMVKFDFDNVHPYKDAEGNMKGDFLVAWPEFRHVKWFKSLPRGSEQWILARKAMEKFAKVLQDWSEYRDEANPTMATFIDDYFEWSISKDNPENAIPGNVNVLEAFEACTAWKAVDVRTPYSSVGPKKPSVHKAAVTAPDEEGFRTVGSEAFVKTTEENRELKKELAALKEKEKKEKKEKKKENKKEAKGEAPKK